MTTERDWQQEGIRESRFWLEKEPGNKGELGVDWWSTTKRVPSRVPLPFSTTLIFILGKAVDQ